MKTLKIFFLFLIAGVFGLAAIGCGESGGPNPTVEKARVDEAVEMRKLFDNVGGDYAKLDPESKAKFDKYAGGTEAAQKTWAMMKYGAAGAAPSAGGVSNPPPGSGQ